MFLDVLVFAQGSAPDRDWYFPFRSVERYAAL